MRGQCGFVDPAILPDGLVFDLGQERVRKEDAIIVT
jgi:hypothetical protein